MTRPASIRLGAVDLSVVVPCYNEEARLPRSLGAVSQYLASRQASFELILVDDGSTDGTAPVIRQAERERPNVRAVLLLPNRGKGRALAEFFSGQLAGQSVEMNREDRGGEGLDLLGQ